MIDPSCSHVCVCVDTNSVPWDGNLRVCTVEAWMLMLPLGLLLGLDDGFCFAVAGGPVCLILCCTFLRQGVSGLVAQHITVGMNPLKCDSVTSAEGGKRGRQIVQFRTSV